MTLQIFSRSPRSLKPPRPFDPRELEEFRSGITALDVRPVVVHIPYLLNLASPDESRYRASIDALREDLIRSGSLGADYLVIHPGSHMGEGIENGIQRIGEAIREALEDASGFPHPQILLETVSGAGTEVGSRFEELRAIMDVVGIPETVGVCLDTCHVYVAGYDIASESGWNDTLEEFEANIGLVNLKVVHINDSVGELGSKKDRHAHIGEGKIGLSGFRFILGDRAFSDKPFILETPHDRIDADARNLAVLRSLAKDLLDQQGRGTLTEIES